MWVDIVAWFQSPGGARVLQTAIIPALAILVAGLLAAAIARSAVRATLRRAERTEATSAVAALVSAARAAADSEGDPISRRRIARLRSEADVRTRLLPLPGAALAADWASARIDALQDRPADDASGTQVGELRDGLVQWVSAPKRARRLFSATPAPKSPAATPAAPAAQPATAADSALSPAPAPAAPAAQPSAEAEPAAPAQPTPATEHERFAPPAAAPNRAPQAESAEAPEPEPAAAASAPVESVPAWQRTRTVERLQQERGRTRGAETPAPEAEPEASPSTAPVLQQHPHRAGGAPAADSDEAVRLEAHLQARHARPVEPPATGAVPAAPPAQTPAQTQATPAPAWLDNYDDEAQVTQNLDLKTPPPVAASAVRDRGKGEDLVPRS